MINIRQVDKSAHRTIDPEYILGNECSWRYIVARHFANRRARFLLSSSRAFWNRIPLVNGQCQKTCLSVAERARNGRGQCSASRISTLQKERRDWRNIKRNGSCYVSIEEIYYGMGWMRGMSFGERWLVRVRLTSVGDYFFKCDGCQWFEVVKWEIKVLLVLCN